MPSSQFAGSAPATRGHRLGLVDDAEERPLGLRLVEPAVYSTESRIAAIAGWRCIPIANKRFHETNPERGPAVFATRSRLSLQPSNDGHDNYDQDAGNKRT